MVNDTASTAASPSEERQAVTRTRRTARILLGTLISLCCLVLVLRGVQWSGVASALGNMDLLLLVAAIIVEFLTFWAIAARWQRLFAPHECPAQSRLFGILTIAQLVNGVLPTKLGPLVRAYLAGKGESDGVAFALTTIVGEKVLEGTSLLAIGIGLLPFVSLAEWLRPAMWASAVALLVALGLVLWATLHRDMAGRWMETLVGRWPRLLGAARSALAALDVWRDWRAVLVLAGWSLLIWAVTAFLNQLLLWCLGIDVPLLAPLLLLVVLQIGVRVPSSPGSIGVFHYLSVVTLVLFGVEKELALSYGVLLHLVTYLPPSLLGVVYLGKSGYSLSHLRQSVGTVPTIVESQG